MEQVETEGLVLSCRPYKEQDQLIKIFTEKYGKAMFLVKRAANPNYMYRASLRQGTGATYIARIHDDGLSFINSVKEPFSFSKVQGDFISYPYAQYILSLCDYALDDHEPDPLLYGLLKQALILMDKGYDASVIAAIFAIQVLNRFGVTPEWDRCVCCGENRFDIPFDYSEQYNGVICYRHFDTLHRYHATPRAIYFIRQFTHVTFELLEEITLSDETKEEIWRVIDTLYDSYTGVHLKSRSYSDHSSNVEALFAKLRQTRIDK